MTLGRGLPGRARRRPPPSRCPRGSPFLPPTRSGSLTPSPAPQPGLVRALPLRHLILLQVCPPRGWGMAWGERPLRIHTPSQPAAWCAYPTRPAGGLPRHLTVGAGQAAPPRSAEQLQWSEAPHRREQGPADTRGGRGTPHPVPGMRGPQSRSPRRERGGGRVGRVFAAQREARGVRPSRRAWGTGVGAPRGGAGQ